MDIKPPIRFVFITQDYFPDIGGITTWVYELARHVKMAGHEVLIVTKSFDQFDGTEVQELPVLRLPHARWKQRKYSRLKAVIASLNDGRTIFLCANWKMAVPCLWLSLTTEIPYFVAVFGLDAIEGRFKNRLLQQCTLWRARGVLPISTYTHTLLSMPKLKRTDRVHILPTGVDTTVFQVRARNRVVEEKYGIGPGFRVLNIGRLIERKGFDTTIRAMALMKRPDVHYYIGGTGPYEPTLRALVSELGIGEQVHFLGFIAAADLVDIYNAADIFCMPSRELPFQVEGYGITYLEAAACGVPSIGGRRSGAEDAIVHGETGMLVDANSPTDLAGAIERLVNDEGFRLKLGEQARVRVERGLTWKSVTARLFEIIRQA